MGLIARSTSRRTTPVLLARPRGLASPEVRTLAIGAVGLGITAAAIAAEVARVWRRGSAPLPSEAPDALAAAEEAVSETVEVAVVGYQEMPDRENAMFNLLVSFVSTFALARSITFMLRSRQMVGPFRNLVVARRHIHHFVPGIILAFASGAAAITTSNRGIEPKLAIPFGVGMGLTLDESALLLELDDVYWSREGLVSIQISLTVAAFLGALMLGARFLRRGEQIVLEEDSPALG